MVHATRSGRKAHHSRTVIQQSSSRGGSPLNASILRSVQYEAFRKDIECLKRSEKLPSTSPLANLCPVLDKDGLLRVGGRLNEADISNGERHPLILPKSCHTSELIINLYHCKVQHQGRVFTHGLIRSSGYWIIGGKRMVNSIIDKCLKCKKLRGQHQTQFTSQSRQPCTPIQLRRTRCIRPMASLRSTHQRRAL